MAMPTPQTPTPGTVLRRLVRNIGSGLRDAALLPFHARLPREWVVLRLDRGLVESAHAPSWIGDALQRRSTLASALECLELAREDGQVRGVLLRLGRAPLGWAQVSALARGVQALRAAGKQVVAYAEHAGNAGAWLGALADRFWMAPQGRLDLVGIRAETPYLRGALDKLGVRPEVFFAGRYKSAGEVLERSSMSPAAREALEEVVGGLYDALLEGLAAGRAGDAQRARDWVDGGPYLAAQAQEIGLVDACVYPDELPARLAALEPEGAGGGPDAEARPVSAAAYLRAARPRFGWQPLIGAGELAVVPIQGLLAPGSGSERGVVGVLRRLAKDHNVSAVVLRVDSPGGDPLAADLIWRAVRQLAEAKPVVASLGDTAASGGYYVAVGAHAIVAEPTTLTGSIGVVMASLDFEGLLANLGVRVDAVERGRHAGIFDPSRPRSPEERALLKRQVRQLYAEFVSKVSEGRPLPAAKVEAVAQGRVWTGERAHAYGLVDALGGLDLALSRVRELAALGPDEGRVVHYAPLPPLLTRLFQRGAAERGGWPPGAQLWCPIEIPLA